MLVYQRVFDTLAGLMMGTGHLWEEHGLFTTLRTSPSGREMWMALRFSMDWFTRKSPGNHRFSHDICFFGKFSLKPIHWAWVSASLCFATVRSPPGCETAGWALGEESVRTDHWCYRSSFSAASEPLLWTHCDRKLTLESMTVLAPVILWMAPECMKKQQFQWLARKLKNWHCTIPVMTCACRSAQCLSDGGPTLCAPSRSTCSWIRNNATM